MNTIRTDGNEMQDEMFQTLPSADRLFGHFGGVRRGSGDTSSWCTGYKPKLSCVDYRCKGHAADSESNSRIYVTYKREVPNKGHMTQHTAVDPPTFAPDTECTESSE
jgi:hypothetical protein